MVIRSNTVISLCAWMGSGMVGGRGWNGYLKSGTMSLKLQKHLGIQKFEVPQTSDQEVGVGVGVEGRRGGQILLETKFCL